MNALLISGIYRPEIGGPATYVPALAEQLISQKNKVQVITLKNSQAKPIDEEWPVTYVTRDQFLLFRFAKTCLLISKNMKVIDNLISVSKIGFFLKKKNLTKKMNKKKKNLIFPI